MKKIHDINKSKKKLQANIKSSQLPFIFQNQINNPCIGELRKKNILVTRIFVSTAAYILEKQQNDLDMIK